VRYLLAACATLALLLTAASPAVASCVEESLADRVARAQAIASGTVSETRQTFAPAGGVIKFRPTRVLKGTLPAEIEVFLGPTRGGALTSVDSAVARTGQTHTLYLREASETGRVSYETDACSGSHTGEPSEEETKLLGQGTFQQTVDHADSSWIAPLAFSVAAIVALAAIALVRARRVSAR